MQDKELYQHILGLKSPWSVTEVRLDMENQQIDGNRPPNRIFPRVVACPCCTGSHSGAEVMAEDKGPRRDSAKERFWRELIVGQAASGLSVRAWCLRCEVSEASFYAWRRELARRDAAGNMMPRFAEVVVRDQREEAALVANERPLQVYLDDVRIEVPTGFDSATLRTVLQLLRGESC